VLRWARSAEGAVLVGAVPRYLPGWSRPLLRVPVLREFATWNLLLVLREAQARSEPSMVSSGADDGQDTARKTRCGVRGRLASIRAWRTPIPR
jgi:hypothetical protein